jgi:hypothetical protein
MPLTRKGSEILEKMRQEYGDKKGTGVFYASANKGTITGVHQTHHKPVTNSPFHSLRPPKPEGANADGSKDYIPAGRRRVISHTDAVNEKDVPRHMNAAAKSQHQRLAKEVASGLRRFTFAQVAQNQQNPRTQT